MRRIMFGSSLSKLGVVILSLLIAPSAFSQTGVETYTFRPAFNPAPPTAGYNETVTYHYKAAGTCYFCDGWFAGYLIGVGIKTTEEITRVSPTYTNFTTRTYYSDLHHFHRCSYNTYEIWTHSYLNLTSPYDPNNPSDPYDNGLEFNEFETQLVGAGHQQMGPITVTPINGGTITTQINPMSFTSAQMWYDLDGDGILDNYAQDSCWGQGILYEMTTTYTQKPTGFALPSWPRISTYAEPPIKINCGGGAVSPDWIADCCYNGGGSGYTGSYIATYSVPSPAPLPVYQSWRTQWYTPDPLVYTIGQRNNRPYKVRLHFADFYFYYPGNQLFDIRINGQLIWPGIDIINRVGRFTGMVLETTVWPSNSQITISLTPLAYSYCASINGIEIIPQ